MHITAELSVKQSESILKDMFLIDNSIYSWLTHWSFQS